MTRGNPLTPAPPFKRLPWAIARIVGGIPQSRLSELLPWAYPTIAGLEAAA